MNTNPPSGMRDFLPAEVIRRRHVAGVIARVFEAHGFVPLETPAVENLEILLGKYGDEGDQLLFRLLHRREKLQRALATTGIGESDLADTGLRYDLTVPLARVVANNPDLPKYFKRYQIQPVWRADRPGKGRFREFMQCDVDIMGVPGMIAEAEVCCAIAWVLSELGIRDFVIHVNHRQLLKALIKKAGVDPAAETTALVAVDKLDKIGHDGVVKELSERGIGASQAEALMRLLTRPTDTTNDAELTRLAEALGADAAGDPEAHKAIEELRELLRCLAVGPAADCICIDATLARGLGYYTGPIFEIRAHDLKGSLGGGGRYDGLIGMFCNRQIPAVGFSIGFERLIMVLEERKLFGGELRAGADVLLCRFPEVSAVDALRVAHTLRQAGLRVELFPEATKIGKQLGYAEEQGIRVAAIIGSNELASGKLALKHLAKREQVIVDMAAVADQVRAWIAPARA